ncbi:hypothetical protein ACWEPD_21735 [Streptomyces pseudogriseolus]|uniref:hypothetical protein n=1 Tax=Streptomyces pseudogriseolus TaxID=36817 RepID=UPI003FA1BACF|nr:hypothetical protein [Streptomyces pseudogriseolus]
MSGRPDADLPPDTQTAEDTTEDAREDTPRVDVPEDTPVDAPEESPENSHEGDDEDDEGDDEDLLAARARRARWAAVGTGAVLALAGTAAAVLRAAGTAPVLVPVAYACGAAVCALAAVMGSRARTRRALWTTVAGVMVMALGDQFD